MLLYPQRFFFVSLFRSNVMTKSNTIILSMQTQTHINFIDFCTRQFDCLWDIDSLLHSLKTKRYGVFLYRVHQRRIYVRIVMQSQWPYMVGAFSVMLWCCVVWRFSRVKCKKDTIIVSESESERNTLKRTLTAWWRQSKPKWKEKWQNNAACREKSRSLSMKNLHRCRWAVLRTVNRKYVNIPVQRTSTIQVTWLVITSIVLLFTGNAI